MRHRRPYTPPAQDALRRQSFFDTPSARPNSQERFRHPYQGDERRITKPISPRLRVIDLETTGDSFANGGVVEVGWQDLIPDDD